MDKIDINKSKLPYGLVPQLNKNDKTAKLFIWIVSIIVFTAVALLSKYKLKIDLGFNPHLFAQVNACINSLVTVILIAALVAVKKQSYLLHKRLMLVAIVLSLIFPAIIHLPSFVCW